MNKEKNTLELNNFDSTDRKYLEEIVYLVYHEQIVKV